MNVQIEESWKQVLTPEFDKDYFIRLTEFVRREYQTTTVYPPGKLSSVRTHTTVPDKHMVSVSL